MIFYLKEEKELIEITKQISQNIKHNIILLEGEMGSGKTTFSRYFFETLQSSDKISSPTYSIVNEYTVSDTIWYHFDLYRINDPLELLDMGFEEYIEKGNCLIEWPQIGMQYLPIDFHKIIITFDGLERKIEFL